MLKLISKKIFTFYAENLYLSKPVRSNTIKPVSSTIGIDHGQVFSETWSGHLLFESVSTL